MIHYNVSHLCNDYTREHAGRHPSLDDAKAWCRNDGAVKFRESLGGEWIARNKHGEAIHVITKVES